MRSENNTLASPDAFPDADNPASVRSDSDCARGVSDAHARACPPSLRPTEYTAALLRQLRLHRNAVVGARALEMGCGSGVVLAALSSFGAQSVCGIDIEDESVLWASSLLRDIGCDNAAVYRGDMWEPVAGRKFDLIAANLSHFPMQPARFGSRMPSWGSGGLDGRRFLDRFLQGLSEHLEPGGRAAITHNAFVDLDRSREILEESGFALEVLDTLSVYIPQEKLELISPIVLMRERDRTLWKFGPYAFGDMHIVQITTRSGQ
jgi:release factor glutamine methyltransferase